MSQTMGLLATFLCGCVILAFFNSATAHPLYKSKDSRGKVKHHNHLSKRNTEQLQYHLSADLAKEIEQTTKSVEKGSLGNCDIKYELVTLSDSLPSFYYKATCPQTSNCCKTEIQSINTTIIYLSKSNGQNQIQAKSGVTIGCVCSEQSGRGVVAGNVNS
ncbi:hypothetical protein CHUAL_004656 [Chamberlinius hualienensis]